MCQSLWHLLLCLFGWQRSTGPCKLQEADHVYGPEDLKLGEVWWGFLAPERYLSKTVPVGHDRATILSRMWGTKVHKQLDMVIPGCSQSGAGSTKLQQPAALWRSARGTKAARLLSVLPLQLGRLLLKPLSFPAVLHWMWCKTPKNPL